jgi:hypothetical protein
MSKRCSLLIQDLIQQSLQPTEWEPYIRTYIYCEPITPLISHFVLCNITWVCNYCISCRRITSWCYTTCISPLSTCMWLAVVSRTLTVFSSHLTNVSFPISLYITYLLISLSCLYSLHFLPISCFASKLYLYPPFIYYASYRLIFLISFLPVSLVRLTDYILPANLTSIFSLFAIPLYSS